MCSKCCSQTKGSISMWNFAGRKCLNSEIAWKSYHNLHCFITGPLFGVTELILLVFAFNFVFTLQMFTFNFTINLSTFLSSLFTLVFCMVRLFSCALVSFHLTNVYILLLFYVFISYWYFIFLCSHVESNRNLQLKCLEHRNRTQNAEIEHG
jgi:hypothetical protein